MELTNGNKLIPKIQEMWGLAVKLKKNTEKKIEIVDYYYSFQVEEKPILNPSYFRTLGFNNIHGKYLPQRVSNKFAQVVKNATATLWKALLPNGVDSIAIKFKTEFNRLGIPDDPSSNRIRTELEEQVTAAFVEYLKKHENGKFLSVIAQLCESSVKYGTSCLICMFDYRNQKDLIFYNIPIQNVYFLENHKKNPDIIFIKETLSKDQYNQRFNANEEADEIELINIFFHKDSKIGIELKKDASWGSVIFRSDKLEFIGEAQEFTHQPVIINRMSKLLDEIWSNSDSFNCIDAIINTNLIEAFVMYFSKKRASPPNLIRDKYSITSSYGRDIIDVSPSALNTIRSLSAPSDLIGEQRPMADIIQPLIPLTQASDVALQQLLLKYETQITESHAERVLSDYAQPRTATEVMEYTSQKITTEDMRTLNMYMDITIVLNIIYEQIVPFSKKVQEILKLFKEASYAIPFLKDFNIMNCDITYYTGADAKKKNMDMIVMDQYVNLSSKISQLHQADPSGIDQNKALAKLEDITDFNITSISETQNQQR